jgi:hypothetical protein
MFDKLDGRITGAFFDRMAGEAHDEQERIGESITEHRRAIRGQLDQGARLLEMASSAADDFRRQADGAAKRELVKFLLANASWREGELVAELRPPFDSLAREAQRTRS